MIPAAGLVARCAAPSLFVLTALRLLAASAADNLVGGGGCSLWFPWCHFPPPLDSSVGVASLLPPSPRLTSLLGEEGSQEGAAGRGRSCTKASLEEYLCTEAALAQPQAALDGQPGCNWPGYAGHGSPGVVEPGHQPGAAGAYVPQMEFLTPLSCSEEGFLGRSQPPPSPLPSTLLPCLCLLPRKAAVPAPFVRFCCTLVLRGPVSHAGPIDPDIVFFYPVYTQPDMVKLSVAVLQHPRHAFLIQVLFPFQFCMPSSPSAPSAPPTHTPQIALPSCFFLIPSSPFFATSLPLSILSFLPCALSLLHPRPSPTAHPSSSMS